MQVGANSMIWTLPLTDADLGLVRHVRELGFDVFEVVIGREPPHFPTRSRVFRVAATTTLARLRSGSSRNALELCLHLRLELNRIACR